MRIGRQVLELASDLDTRQAVALRMQLRIWSRKERLRAVVGEGTYFNGGANIVRYELPPEPLTVGAYTSIARGVQFLTAGNHRTEWIAMSPVFPSKVIATDNNNNGPIVVGSDVWIGTDAVVLSGVTIGDGAVVAARAVVSKDVEPYAMVGGVPARKIGSRFDAPTVERLLKAKWWSWPRPELDSIADLLHSSDIEALLAYAEIRVQ
jgi:acetyltransferase-like isoleucine patch superfamily enzyme